MRKVIFSILFIAIFGNMALCQTNRAKWSVGGGLTIVDFGNNFEEKEFNQYYQFKYVDNTASIFVTRSLCRVFDLRGHFGTGRVDFGGQIPRTENYPKAKPYYNGDLSLILKFAKANTENPQIITPYLYGGIGVTNMFFF